MRLFRLLAIFMVTLGVVSIWPTSASAGGPPPTALSAPILADLNGDGLRDKAVLGQIGTTTTCTVTVQDGVAGGGFGPPKVHRYTSVESFPPCPDKGTAIKLGNDKRPDLVTGFNFGFTDIVALHQFQPSAVFTGVEQPDLMVAADFTGDGRDDLLEYTNEGSGLVTFTNTPAGTLVRGAISVCEEAGLGPQYALADLNGDGGQDILLSQVCPRAQPSVMAVVLFGNGGRQILTSSCDDTLHYTVFVIDLDRNGVPDVGVITTKTNTPSTIRYFQNDGAGHFTEVTGPGSGPVQPSQPPSMGNPCGT
jgi:hypothetical protein